MAVTVYFRDAADLTTPTRFSLGTDSARLSTANVGWTVNPLATTRGASLQAHSMNTVTGPTNGIETSDGAFFEYWVTPPLDADVTIAGTITLNLWAGENNMSANAAINAILERIDSTGAIVSTIANTARTTELGTTIAVNNFTVTPTSTNMLKGDRIRIRVYIDDAGTMATGFSATFDYAGATGGADGDSYVTFTETFGFLTTDPTTTTLYPTNVNTSPLIDPDADTERDMWTSRGGATVNLNQGSTTGWTVPIRWTSGGTNTEWFSRPLSAFTLAGPVLLNIRSKDADSLSKAAVRVELAVCASDGTGATVWAATTHPTALTSTDTAYVFYLAGGDLAITDGQRIRVRFYLDDSSTTPMVTGKTCTVSFAGTSGGAAGDTYLIFGQSLTEYVTAGAELPILVMAPRR